MSDYATADMVLRGEQRWAVEQGDAIEWMNCLPEDCVDTVLFSPPYESARLYLENGKNLGIARKTDAWVSWMVEVMRACRRVCKGLVACVCEGQTKNYSYSASPVLLMAALIQEGFVLRKPPIYHRVGIPGSGGPDWLRNDYEFVVCTTRGGRLPFSDNTAMGHPPKWEPGGEVSYRAIDGTRVNERKTKLKTTSQGSTSSNGGDGETLVTVRRDIVLPEKANPGNVIRCLAGGGQLGHPLAHENEAPYSLTLAEFFVRSFCPPGGIVLDCFSGSGTTGHAAKEHGRRFIGCDIRQSQVLLSQTRLEGVTPPLPGFS